MVFGGISSQKGWLKIDRKLYMYGWVSYWQVFENLSNIITFMYTFPI